jgi:hypothetical protein
MGLLGSGKKEGKFNKFKKLTEKDAKNILGYMDSKHKEKVKKYLKNIDKGEKSIHQVSQELQEKIGSEAKRKFIHAAKKDAGGGLTEKEKRRNLARRREETGQGSGSYIRSTISFAGGDVESGHRVTQNDPGDSNDPSSGFVGGREKRSIGVNDSSERGGRSGFVNSPGTSFAGDSGKGSGGGKKKGGKKPLGL